MCINARQKKNQETVTYLIKSRNNFANIILLRLRQNIDSRQKEPTLPSVLLIFIISSVNMTKSTRTKEKGLEERPRLLHISI